MANTRRVHKKSRVLLQLCLAMGMDRDAIQDAFYHYWIIAS